MSETQRYIEMMRRRVEIGDSTGYFMRTVSTREYEQTLKKGYTSEFRWFMLVNHCIPPQLLNWMCFEQGPRKYTHAILLTPAVTTDLGLEIDQPDTPQMDFWYPAVQLFMRNKVPGRLIRDATGLVRDVAAQLTKPINSLEIVKAVSNPIPVEILENLPPLTA